MKKTVSTKWHPKEMLDITFQMRDVRQVSGIFSGIKFVYAGAIYMVGIDHLYQFQMNLSTKMVSDGNAGYCIPDARFETSFRHIFRP